MQPRKVGWFSCGAASAVACRIAQPDVVAYCHTGSEHEDNSRFMADCERTFGWQVEVLRSKVYVDTWDVWERRNYLAGIAGAPCTGELKIKPRLAFQRPDDVHVFGYTSDSSDRARADALVEHWPDMTCEFPLIEQGLDKAACLALLDGFGIEPPVTYAMGFPNANCIPCPKATSPDYWALVRLKAPDEFDRMAKLSRRLGVKLTRINGVRVYIDEIPEDWPVTQPLAPACDMLCQLAEQDLVPVVQVE